MITVGLFRHYNTAVNGTSTALITSPAIRVQSIAITGSVCLVCLYVCLFVYPLALAYLGNYTLTFNQMFLACHLCPWLGLSLMSVQYVMYFRFCGWHYIFMLWSECARIKDDVYVSSSLPGGGIRGRSLASPTAFCTRYCQPKLKLCLILLNLILYRLPYSVSCCYDSQFYVYETLPFVCL